MAEIDRVEEAFAGFEAYTRHPDHQGYDDELARIADDMTTGWNEELKNNWITQEDYDQLNSRWHEVLQRIGKTST